MLQVTINIIIDFVHIYEHYNIAMKSKFVVCLTDFRYWKFTLEISSERRETAMLEGVSICLNL
jgi:hypothetical protein